MKKVLALFLGAAAALSLTACSAGKEPAVSDGGSSDSAVSSATSSFPAESVSSGGVSATNSSDEKTSDEKAEYKSLTILGDSIATGCMLPQYEPGNNYSAPDSFGNMLGAEFESYRNLAVDGRTTEELLNALNSPDEELSEALSSADVIVVSIGGNDFLRPMISALLNDSELSAEMSEEGYSPDTSDEAFQKAMDAALEAAKNVDVTKTLDNVSKCVRVISETNPNAEIILMTVYNPFSGNDEFKTASDVAGERLTLLNFGLKSLNGGKTSVIDVYSEFDGNAEKYTNISAMDIHPNTDGHYKIYRLLKKQLKT